MTSIYGYSATAASNNSAAPDGAPENMAPSGLNDTIRKVMANLAEFVIAPTAGGTADALTVTPTNAVAALVDGMIMFVRAAAANATTTPTFAPSGLTARAITKNGGSALAVGDIAGAGHVLALQYQASGTKWELLNPKVGSSLEGLLTTTGDIAYASAANTPARLAVGTSAQVLKGGTSPSYGSVDGTMVRMGSDAQGDILYFDGTNYARLAPGTSGQFLKTQGAGANPVWANGGLVPLSRVTGADVAAYTWTTAGWFTTYRTLKLIGWLQPVADDVELWVRVSDDGGSSYEADASDYAYWWDARDGGGSTQTKNSAGDVKIAIGSSNASNSVGNASNERIQFEITLNNPNSAAFYKLFDIKASYIGAGGTLIAGQGGGASLAAAAVNGLQLLFESGNIALGDVTLYGLANA